MSEPETSEHTLEHPLPVRSKTAKDLPWKLRIFLAMVFGSILGAGMGSVIGLVDMFL